MRELPDQRRQPARFRGVEDSVYHPGCPGIAVDAIPVEISSCDSSRLLLLLQQMLLMLQSLLLLLLLLQECLPLLSFSWHIPVALAVIGLQCVSLAAREGINHHPPPPVLSPLPQPLPPQEPIWAGAAAARAGIARAASPALRVELSALVNSGAAARIRVALFNVADFALSHTNATRGAAAVLVVAEEVEAKGLRTRPESTHDAGLRPAINENDCG